MTVRFVSAVLLLFFAAAAFATPPPVAPNRQWMGGTTDNDASCDIGLYPAATLLLPYFEVDIESQAGVGETTLFTITNTTNLPQVAHITLWTDWSYPVIDFNVYLTGYDVQSINLYDVIARGRLAPDSGTGSAISPVGSLSGNPVTDVDRDNPLVNEASCASAAPVQLSQPFITRMQQAFVLGRVPAHGSLAACPTVGTVHENAVGYVTIDVNSTCSTALPTDPDYFTRDILFDNVLVGDYQQVNGGEDFAQGSPMVHIRAIPEGGTPQTRAADPGSYEVPFRRTFYSRYQPAATNTADGRQPLPSLFAARWISGGATGYQTSFKIWREGITNGSAACSAYVTNSDLDVLEFVRFDEEENPTTFAPEVPICAPLEREVVFPPTSLRDVSNHEFFPETSSGDVAGWMYLNLDHCNADAYGTQAWVTVSMRAEGRYSTDIDAPAMGNGCTPEVAETTAIGGAKPIGPAPNVNP